MAVFRKLLQWLAPKYKSLRHLLSLSYQIHRPKNWAKTRFQGSSSLARMEQRSPFLEQLAYRCG